MNWREDLAGESQELEKAIMHFKASVDAWSCAVLSDAALSRPRTAAKTAVRRSWRPAASWALGCMLAAGTLTGAVHRFVHRQEMAKLAAQRAAQKTAEVRTAAERVSAQARNRAPVTAVVNQEAGAQDAALLASVDNDVSQQVPDAMEPLAQLMDDNGTQ